MKLTTTLNKIRAYTPCPSGWKMLLKHLGKTGADDAEINLLTILKSNGVQDMLWCLRATKEDSKKIASQLAIEFAEEVLPIFEKRYPDDKRPRNAIQGARDYLAGKIDSETLRKFRSAALDASHAAYADASHAAAAAAHADADSAYAAYAAYAAASHAAAAAAHADAREKACQRQTEIIRNILS